jgi:hypothetical protein
LLLGLLLALKMEALCCSSKTSVDLYNTTQHDIPEDGTLLFVQLKKVVAAVLLKTFEQSKNCVTVPFIGFKMTYQS